jgi:hypothetical protein
MTRNAILAIASALVIALISLAASFAGSVNGYTRKDGTYVAPYERSAPDNSYNNNWSVRGNTNPYTGEEGTKSPTFNDRTPQYNTKTYGNPGYENESPGLQVPGEGQ